MITLDSNNLTMNQNHKVSYKTKLEIAGTNSKLEVEHIADFSKIPIEYHQIYFESFVYQMNNSKIYNNFKPETIKKKQKWKLNNIVEILFNTIKKPQ
jgi:hypothetical protein